MYADAGIAFEWNIGKESSGGIYLQHQFDLQNLNLSSSQVTFLSITAGEKSLAQWELISQSVCRAMIPSLS